VIPGRVTFGDAKGVQCLACLQPHLAALLIGQGGKFVWTYFFPGIEKKRIQRRLSRNRCFGTWPFSLGDLRIAFELRVKGR